MLALRTLARVVVVCAAIAQGARADAIVGSSGWRWVEWTPGRGGQVLSNVNGPSPFVVVEPPASLPAFVAPAPIQVPVPPPAPPPIPTTAPAPPPVSVATPVTPPVPISVTPPPAPPIVVPPPAPVPVAALAPMSTPPFPPVIPAQSTISVSGSNDWRNLGRWAVTSPVPSAVPVVAAPPSIAKADALINFGSGPFPAANNLTTGNPQTWSVSPVVTQLFGGVPNDQQRADFTNTVLQRVEQTYEQSGIPVQLTLDPNAPAAHTLSVVSNASYGTNPNVAGITYEGGDGFSFIDKFGSAHSIDQLEWVVAHNVAHELMHAFGGEHHDTTGTYLDSGVSPWSLMIDPNATFGPASVQELLSRNFQDSISSPLNFDGQIIDTASVPEPGSLAAWSVLGLAIAVCRLRRRAV
jgi:hypothetical protein